MNSIKSFPSSIWGFMKTTFWKAVRSSGFWFSSIFATLVVGVVLSFLYWDLLRAGTQTAESYGATIRNIGVLVGGIVALVFAIWRSIVAQEQLDVAQRGLLNDRYQKGAEMLGNSSLAVRLGGINTLLNLAKESPEQYHVQVMTLLCALVRHPFAEVNATSPIASEDALIAMYAIGSRHPALIELEEKEGFVPNLSGVSLFRTNLSGAVLTGVNLSSASLHYVNISGAVLTGGNLSSADLGGTDLSGAILVGADLSDARLYRADLTEAMLPDANLSGAELLTANLSRAVLSSANLSGVYLSNAEEPGLYEALGLTQAQLDQAVADPDNQPKLEGVLDAETGEQLVWRGKPLVD